MFDYPKLDFLKIYQKFSSPINERDCGQECSKFNLNNIPFCCDLSFAIPAAYHDEWQYLKKNTDLWRVWKVEDLPIDEIGSDTICEDVPENMLLLACKGVSCCQRDFRALGCRQFPFFPYITNDFRFIGLAYEWEFENKCWVISHLDQVSDPYRQEFVLTFDEIFNLWPEEMESYAIKSEEMRKIFKERKQRIPILHRNGKNYLISPKNERINITPSTKFKKFNPYLPE